MDFAILPPEINSGRMYSGPGSGPMLAAAAAWNGLAAELHSTATSYGSVISELSAGPWLGAASAAMTSATAPYVAWLRSTAGQAEQTAIQARAAAAAYEVTFAAMVPPPVIEANRALLQALVATNLFGQNSPAIAATETLYAEMWAQDATAMYGYAGTSASATTLTSFTPAPQTTNGASAAANAQPATSQLASTALPGLTSTAAVTDPLNTLANLIDVVLFLPNVAQAGLTPLNTTSIFADLSFDDAEVRDEALADTENQIAAALKIPGYAAEHDARAGDSVGSRGGPIGDSSARAGFNGRKVVGATSLDCGGPGGQACRADVAGHQPGRCPRGHGSQQFRKPFRRNDPGKHDEPRHQRHQPRKSGAHQLNFPLPARTAAHVAQRPRHGNRRRHSRIRSSTHHTWRPTRLRAPDGRRIQRPEGTPSRALNRSTSL